MTSAHASDRVLAPSSARVRPVAEGSTTAETPTGPAPHQEQSVITRAAAGAAGGPRHRRPRRGRSGNRNGTASVPGRIVATGLTKTYGAVTAVRELSFTVEPGSVTGFLGPNGAGKTTTLRMLLGLVRPDAGVATISGRRYAELPAPGREVGAVLDAGGFHPARSGGDHLRVYCTVNGCPHRRANEMLELVGLAAAGRRPVRGYSLGMRQRLALATALLGDPHVLVLDEPANGLDPEGIAWLRRLLRGLADQGRTVLVSSHVLSEMQQLVDHVVIINRGRLVRQGALAELSDVRGRAVWVRTPQPQELVTVLARHAASGTSRTATRIERTGPDRLRVTGVDPAEIGRLALTERIELHELASERSDLEQVFFALTATAGNIPATTHHLEEVR
jgi:ABC-2 type transport system ATP-binding protein